MADIVELNEDEQRLAELGYKQELNRSWSGFSNFAISFSIISILAGCFTSFGLGWNNGGPAAISWGWPIISAVHPGHRAVHVRAGVGFPDVGRHLLVGQQARRPEGGLLHRLAEPDRPARHRRLGRLRLRDVLRRARSSTYSTSWATGYSFNRVFLYFIVVLALAALVNIFSSHLLAVLNNISVWWHVFGAAVVVLILVFVPKPRHADASAEVFTGTVNNTGFFGGQTSGAGFILHVLPLAVDPDPVHDHRLRRVGPPVRGDEERRQLGGQGHLAVDLLLGDRWLDPAARVPVRRSGRGEVTAGGGGVAVIFRQALTANWADLVMVISTTGSSSARSPA